MKIVYVVYGYTNPGGTERVLATKANYFAEKGHQVSIVSLKKETENPFFNFSPLISFYNLDIPPSDKKYKQLFIDKVTELFKQIQPDIALTMGFGLTIYLSEVKDKSKKIFEYHFSKYKRKFELAALDKYAMGRLLTDMYSLKRNKVVRKYDCFVVLTDEDKQSWRNIPNIEVIANPRAFVPSNYSELTTKRAIAVGRHTYQKGFESLIDIWADITTKYPDWKLVIFGSGKKKERLEKQIKSLGITGAVELLPPTRNVEEEYKNSSVYVMTSKYEGLPLVLMEAMSCGLPAVSYACKCGPGEIITDEEDGFLVKPGDKKAFIEKLSLLFENRELQKRMGQLAAENMQRYNVEDIMPLWIKLFEKLHSA